ncbi:MAG: hypothetical protein AAGI34_06260 [Pseudomonadota bacterium]
MTAPILITGFEPFAQHTINSSWEGVRLLRSVDYGELGGIEALRLPVDHARAAAEVRAAIAALCPRAVLLSGLATDTAPRLETLARRPAQPGFAGPDLRAGRWAFARARAAMGHARLSRDAGAYVCETAYWTALGAAPLSVPVVFVHVPPLGGAWNARRIARVLHAGLSVLKSL